MHPNLVNYALSYAEHGFSVIPIGSSKKPLIKFADKPPLTNTEIRDLWKKYPTAKWLNSELMKEPPKELINLILSKQKEPSPVAWSDIYRPTKKTKTTDLFEMIANGLGDTGSRNDNLTILMGGLLLRNVDPEAAANLAVIANDNTPDPLPFKEVERTVQSVAMAENMKRNSAR